MENGKHLILWDGECGFCRRCIGWVRTQDRHGIFQDSAYQLAPSPPMTPELRAACENAVHVVKRDGTILRAGRAALFILGQIGHPTLAGILRLPPFLWCVEAGYRLVAQHRDFFARFFFTKEYDAPVSP